MPDYKELIERLRKDSAHYRYNGNPAIGHQYDEAATAIETLLYQLTAAQDKCDALTKAGLIATNRANEALSELSQVKAERDAALAGEGGKDG